MPALFGLRRRQDHSKAGLPAHHPVVGVLGPVEGHRFDQRAHAGQSANFIVSSESTHVPDGHPLMEWRPPSMCSVCTGNGSRAAPRTISWPSIPKPSSTGSIASAAVTVERATFAPPSWSELGRYVVFGAVDVMVGAEIDGEFFFVFSAGDGDGFKAHLIGELHAEVAESADAEDRHEIAGARGAVAQRVEGGYAGAHQRRGFLQR